MRDIKITVLDTLFNQEIAKEYGHPDVGLCPAHKKGEVMIAKGGNRPEGFCGEAWEAIGRYAFALAHGSEGFWPDWIEKRGIAINSCNDGLRPVIFKLEVMEG